MLEDFWDSQIGKRLCFHATYIVANDTKILLKDIKTCNGIPFRRHLWITNAKKFKRLDLQKGDRIQFKAKINRYRKFKVEEITPDNFYYLNADIPLEQQNWQFGLTNVINIEVILRMEIDNDGDSEATDWAEIPSIG